MRRRPLSLVPMMLIPLATAQAQSAPIAVPLASNATSTHAGAAPARAQVRAEVYRAMRDGTWRCATSNRGWCGTTPQDGPPARNPK